MSFSGAIQGQSPKFGDRYDSKLARLRFLLIFQPMLTDFDFLQGAKIPVVNVSFFD